MINNLTPAHPTQKERMGRMDKIWLPRLFPSIASVPFLVSHSLKSNSLSNLGISAFLSLLVVLICATGKQMAVAQSTAIRYSLRLIVSEDLKESPSCVNDQQRKQSKLQFVQLGSYS
jgi:hypothetical protein